MVVIKDGMFDISETEKVKLNGDYDIIDVKNEDPHALDGYFCPYDAENYCDPENIPLQAIYFIGRVLVRKDTENIDKLLKLCIRYTHDSCEDVKNQMILINKREQYRGGTVCPTKKTMFIYEGKVFVYYGRYIFGYDRPHVIFRRIAADTNGKEKACMKNNTFGKTPGFFCSFASFLRKGIENGADMGDSEEEFISSEDESHFVEEELESSSDEEYDENGYIIEKRVEDKITDKKIVLNSPEYKNDNRNDYVYSFLIYDKKTEVIDAFGMYR